MGRKHDYPRVDHATKHGKQVLIDVILQHLPPVAVAAVQAVQGLLHAGGRAVHAGRMPFDPPQEPVDRADHDRLGLVAASSSRRAWAGASWTFHMPQRHGSFFSTARRCTNTGRAVTWTRSGVSWADRRRCPVRLPGWVSGRVSPNYVRLPSPS